MERLNPSQTDDGTEAARRLRPLRGMYVARNALGSRHGGSWVEVCRLNHPRLSYVNDSNGECEWLLGSRTGPM